MVKGTKNNDNQKTSFVAGVQFNFVLLRVF